MEEAAYKLRQFFENGKTYLTKETPFKDRHPFHKRQEEAYRIMEKYPDRVPVICECAGGEIPDIDRKKYLVPNDLGVNQFIYIIRSRMKLPPEKSLYIFVNGSVMPHTGGCISEYYHKYKDDDGFLYISYSGENTFG